MIAIESQHVQGLVRYGYRSLCGAAYLLLSMRDAGAFRRWLSTAVGEVASADEHDPDRVVNVAFTFNGLARIGLDRAAQILFAHEFQEGMAASRHRSASLGDVVDSAPEHWKWGRSDQPLDAVLLLYARDASALDALVDEHTRRLSDAADIVMRLSAMDLPPPGFKDSLREHFGFTDGLVQPTIEGWQTAGSAADIIAAGEFLLGYPNGYGQMPDSPRVPDGGAALPDNDFGRNGTFLVLRQLAQDVQEFWRCQMRACGDDVDAAIRLASRMVGRWPSGAPLVNAPDSERPLAPGDDEFGFATADPGGLRCPLGSHIRRANPRDALHENDAAGSLVDVNRHRLIRRGRPYGAPLASSFEPRDLIERIDSSDNGERGLFFLCLNADLRRQFEFVQQVWINNPRFVASTHEQDPLLGDRAIGDPVFTVQAQPLRMRIPGLVRFVRVIGGAYFFMPSIPALRYLAARADSGGT
jgi:Dyp-type peroxidase family